MVRPRRNWTVEEDAVLRSVVNNALAQSRPLLWRELAKSIPGRSNKDCRRRWWNSLADGTTKGSWAEEEDERLIEAVRKRGTNWSKVARDVGSRNSDQCASHWSQVLDPDINFCDWTTEEDDCLLHAVLTHGTNWSSIAASHVPKRTTLALKNRYSTLRLRHENASKSEVSTSRKRHQASISGPRAGTGLPRKAARTSKNPEKQPIDMADEDGDEEDDETEDENEEDDDVSEEYEIQQNDINENFSAPVTPNSNLASANALGNLAKDLNMMTSNAWPGFPGQSDPLSPKSLHHEISSAPGENWTQDIVSENQLPGVHPYTYSERRESFLGTTQDWPGLSAGDPYAPYNGDGMHLGCSPPTRYPDLSNAALSLSSSPKLTDIGTNSFQPSCDMPAAGTIPSTSSTSFRVSISMVCTAPQLETALRSLAGAGMCVTMQIDPKL